MNLIGRGRYGAVELHRWVALCEDQEQERHQGWGDHGQGEDNPQDDQVQAHLWLS